MSQRALVSLAVSKITFAFVAPTPRARAHPAAASAALNFDFIVNPSVTNHRSRHQHDSLVNFFIECIFWTTVSRSTSTRDDATAK